jgi:hypothetical protein
LQSVFADLEGRKALCVRDLQEREIVLRVHIDHPSASPDEAGANNYFRRADVGCCERDVERLTGCNVHCIDDVLGGHNMSRLRHHEAGAEGGSRWRMARALRVDLNDRAPEVVDCIWKVHDPVFTAVTGEVSVIKCAGGSSGRALEAL